MTTPSNNRIRELINITHKHGVAIREKIKALLRTEHVLEKLNAERRKELREREAKAHPPAEHRITMYDAVTVSNIPHNPEAVAGYVGGSFANYNELLHDFPHAKHLSIAVSASEDAECLDIEKGDAVPAQAPEWVRRQHARGLKRPCLYAASSEMPSVLGAVLGNGIERNEIRIWTAHWTNVPHVEPGSDATQYAGGQVLDKSQCLPTFFD